MKKWKAIVGVTGVFVLGVIAGVLLSIGVAHRAASRGPDGWRDAIVGRLSWQLSLDRQQRDQLQTIVRDAQVELKEVNKQVRPQVRVVLDRAKERVRDMLRPGQHEKFDEIVAKQEAKWEQ